MEREELHLGTDDRIWVTAAFVGQFCDPNVFDAEIQGGFPETSFALLSRVLGKLTGVAFDRDPCNPFSWKAVAQGGADKVAHSNASSVADAAQWNVTDGEPIEPDPVAARTLAPTTLAALREACIQCDRAARIGWSFAVASEPSAYMALSKKLRSLVAGMSDSEALLLPIVWRTNSGGHAISILVEGGNGSDKPVASASSEAGASAAAEVSAATAVPASEGCVSPDGDIVPPGSSSYVATVINTGSGLQYHPTAGKPSLTGNAKHRTAMAIAGIPRSNILTTAFWRRTMVVQRMPAAHHGPVDWYTTILPILVGSVSIEHGVTAAAVEGLHGPASKPQRSGTCYYRCALAAVKHLLVRHGVSESERKRATLSIRFAMASIAADQLKAMLAAAAKAEAEREAEGGRPLSELAGPEREPVGLLPHEAKILAFSAVQLLRSADKAAERHGLDADTLAKCRSLAGTLRFLTTRLDLSNSLNTTPTEAALLEGEAGSSPSTTALATVDSASPAGTLERRTEARLRDKVPPLVDSADKPITEPSRGFHGFDTVAELRPSTPFLGGPGVLPPDSLVDMRLPPPPPKDGRGLPAPVAPETGCRWEQTATTLRFVHSKALAMLSRVTQGCAPANVLTVRALVEDYVLNYLPPVITPGQAVVEGRPAVCIATGGSRYGSPHADATSTGLDSAARTAADGPADPWGREGETRPLSAMEQRSVMKSLAELMGTYLRCVASMALRRQHNANTAIIAASMLAHWGAVSRVVATSGTPIPLSLFVWDLPAKTRCKRRGVLPAGDAGAVDGGSAAAGAGAEVLGFRIAPRLFQPFQRCHDSTLAEWTADALLTYPTAASLRFFLAAYDTEMEQLGTTRLIFKHANFSPMSGAYEGTTEADNYARIMYELGLGGYYVPPFAQRRQVEQRSVHLGARFVRGMSKKKFSQTCPGFISACMYAHTLSQEPEVAQMRSVQALAACTAGVQTNFQQLPCSGGGRLLSSPDCLVSAEDPNGVVLMDSITYCQYFNLFALGPPVARMQRRRIADPACMLERAKLLAKSKLSVSADMPAIGSATEDSVLRAETLPALGGALSPQEGEELVCALLEPSLRIPLVLSFFAAGRLGAFCNQLGVDLVERVLFEPGRVPDGIAPVSLSDRRARARTSSGRAIGIITPEAARLGLMDAAAAVEAVPLQVSEAATLDTSTLGRLSEELRSNPAAVIRPLVLLAEKATEMCNERTASSFYRVFQAVARLMLRVSVVGDGTLEALDRQIAIETEQTKRREADEAAEAAQTGAQPSKRSKRRSEALGEHLRRLRRDHAALSSELSSLTHWIMGPCVTRLLLFLTKVGRVDQGGSGIAVDSLVELVKVAGLSSELAAAGIGGGGVRDGAAATGPSGSGGDDDDDAEGDGIDEEGDEGEEDAEKSVPGSTLESRRVTAYAHLAAVLGSRPVGSLSEPLLAVLLASMAHVTAWLHMEPSCKANTDMNQRAHDIKSMVPSVEQSVMDRLDGLDVWCPAVEAYAGMQRHRGAICDMLTHADQWRRSAMLRLAVACGLNQMPRDVEAGAWKPAHRDDGPLVTIKIESRHPLPQSLTFIETLTVPGAEWIRITCHRNTDISEQGHINFCKDRFGSNRWAPDSPTPGAGGSAPLVVPADSITINAGVYRQKTWEFKAKPDMSLTEDDDVEPQRWGFCVTLEAPVCRKSLAALSMIAISEEDRKAIAASMPAGSGDSSGHPKVPATWPRRWCQQALAECRNDAAAALVWLSANVSKHVASDEERKRSVSSQLSEAAANGLFQSPTGQVTINAQTGEVLLEGRTLERLPVTVTSQPELRVLGVSLDADAQGISALLNSRHLPANLVSEEKRQALQKRALAAQAQGILLGAIIRRFEHCHDWRVMHGPYAYTFRVWSQNYGPAGPVNMGEAPASDVKLLTRSLREPLPVIKADMTSSGDVSVMVDVSLLAADATTMEVAAPATKAAATASADDGEDSTTRVVESEPDLRALNAFSGSPSFAVMNGDAAARSSPCVPRTVIEAAAAVKLSAQLPANVYFYGQPMMQDGVGFYRGQRFSRSFDRSRLGVVGAMLSEHNGFSIADSWAVPATTPVSDTPCWISDGLEEALEASPVWRAESLSAAERERALAALATSAAEEARKPTPRVLGRLLFVVNHDPDGYEGRDAQRWCEMEVMAHRPVVRAFVLLERGRRVLRQLVSSSDSFRDLDAMPLSYPEIAKQPHRLLADAGCRREMQGDAPVILDVQVASEPFIVRFSASGNSWRGGNHNSCELWRLRVAGSGDDQDDNDEQVDGAGSVRRSSSSHSSIAAQIAKSNSSTAGSSSAAAGSAPPAASIPGADAALLPPPRSAGIERLVPRFAFRGILPEALLMTHQFFARSVPLPTETFVRAPDGVWTRPLAILIGYAEESSIKAMRMPVKQVLLVRLFERQFDNPWGAKGPGAAAATTTTTTTSATTGAAASSSSFSAPEGGMANQPEVEVKLNGQVQVEVAALVHRLPLDLVELAIDCIAEHPTAGADSPVKLPEKLIASFDAVDTLSSTTFGRHGEALSRLEHCLSRVDYSGFNLVWMRPLASSGLAAHSLVGFGTELQVDTVHLVRMGVTFHARWLQEPCPPQALDAIDAGDAGGGAATTRRVWRLVCDNLEGRWISDVRSLPQLSTLASFKHSLVLRKADGEMSMLLPTWGIRCRVVHSAPMSRLPLPLMAVESKHSHHGPSNMHEEHYSFGVQFDSSTYCLIHLQPDGADFVPSTPDAAAVAAVHLLAAGQPRSAMAQIAAMAVDEAPSRVLRTMARALIGKSVWRIREPDFSHPNTESYGVTLRFVAKLLASTSWSSSLAAGIDGIRNSLGDAKSSLDWMSRDSRSLLRMVAQRASLLPDWARLTPEELMGVTSPVDGLRTALNLWTVRQMRRRHETRATTAMSVSTTIELPAGSPLVPCDIVFRVSFPAAIALAYSFGNQDSIDPGRQRVALFLDAECTVPARLRVGDNKLEDHVIVTGCSSGLEAAASTMRGHMMGVRGGAGDKDGDLDSDAEDAAVSKASKNEGLVATDAVSKRLWATRSWPSDYRPGTVEASELFVRYTCLPPVGFTDAAARALRTDDRSFEAAAPEPKEAERQQHPSAGGESESKDDGAAPASDGATSASGGAASASHGVTAKSSGTSEAAESDGGEAAASSEQVVLGIRTGKLAGPALPTPPAWVWDEPELLIAAWDAACGLHTAGTLRPAAEEMLNTPPQTSPATLEEAAACGYAGLAEKPADGADLNLYALIAEPQDERSARQDPGLVATTMNAETRANLRAPSKSVLRHRALGYNGIRMTLSAHMMPDALEADSPVIASRAASVMRWFGRGFRGSAAAMGCMASQAEVSGKPGAWLVCLPPPTPPPPLPPAPDGVPDADRPLMFVPDAEATFKGDDFQHRLSAMRIGGISVILRTTLSTRSIQPIINSVFLQLCNGNSPTVMTNPELNRDEEDGAAILTSIRHSYANAINSSVVFDLATGRGTLPQLGNPVSLVPLLCAPAGSTSVELPEVLCYQYLESARPAALAHPDALAEARAIATQFLRERLRGGGYSRHGFGPNTSNKLFPGLVLLACIEGAATIHEHIAAGRIDLAKEVARHLVAFPDISWVGQVRGNKMREKEFNLGGERFGLLREGTESAIWLWNNCVGPRLVGLPAQASSDELLAQNDLCLFTRDFACCPVVPIPVEELATIVTLPDDQVDGIGASSARGKAETTRPRTIVPGQELPLAGLDSALDEALAAAGVAGGCLPSKDAIIELLTQPLLGPASRALSARTGRVTQVARGEERIPTAKAGEVFDGTNAEAAETLPFHPPAAWMRTDMAVDDVRRMAHDLGRAREQASAFRSKVELAIVDDAALDRVAATGVAAVEAMLNSPHSPVAQRGFEELWSALSAPVEATQAAAASLLVVAHEAALAASSAARNAVISQLRARAVATGVSPLTAAVQDGIAAFPSIIKTLLFDTAGSSPEASGHGVVAMLLNITSARAASAAASMHRLGGRLLSLRALAAAVACHTTTAVAEKHCPPGVSGLAALTAIRSALASLASASCSGSSPPAAAASSAGVVAMRAVDFGAELKSLRPAIRRIASELLVRRWCFRAPTKTWPGTTIAPLAETQAAITAAGSTVVDTHALAFEYATGFILRRRQVELVHHFLSALGPDGAGHSVMQLQMGGGKSTCVSPLLAACLEDGRTAVTSVVPEALLEMSRAAQRRALRGPLHREVRSFKFERFALPTLDLLSLDLYDTAKRDADADKADEEQRKTEEKLQEMNAGKETLQTETARRAKRRAERRRRKAASDREWPPHTPLDAAAIIYGDDYNNNGESWRQSYGSSSMGMSSQSVISARVMGAVMAAAERSAAMVEAYISSGGVLVSTPEAVKSLMLQYIDILHSAQSHQMRADELKTRLAKAADTAAVKESVEQPASSGDAPGDGEGFKSDQPSAAKLAEIRSRKVLEADTAAARAALARAHAFIRMSESLRLILSRICGPDSVALVDEVDLIMMPLKSELIFPTGDRAQVDLAPARWDLGMHVLELCVTSAARALRSPHLSGSGGQDASLSLTQTGSSAVDVSLARSSSIGSRASSGGDGEGGAAPLLRRASSWLRTADLPPGASLGQRLLIHIGSDDVTDEEVSEAEDLCKQMEEVVTVGIESSAMQRQPHVVLLSKRYFAAKMLPILQQWTLLWLRRRQAMQSKTVLKALNSAASAAASLERVSSSDPAAASAAAVASGSHGTAPTLSVQPSAEPEAEDSEVDASIVLNTPMQALPEEESIRQILGGAALDGPAASSATAVLSSEGVRLVVSARTWLTNIAPHCLSKANRIDYGLLDGDIASGGGNSLQSSGDDSEELSKRVEPPSRCFLAVPFVALDTPSPSSEFAQPDVRIAMTFLAFRYEGLREPDTRSLVDGLKRALVREHGPINDRSSYKRFDRWLAGSTGRVGDASDRAAVHETAGAMASTAAGAGTAMASAEGLAQDSARAVLPLDLLQTSDAAQASRCHSALRRNSDAIGHYLRTKVFPAVLRAQAERLSASGVDLAGGTLFRRRVGFSGTPSNLLPRGMRCEFEPGSEAEIAQVLTDPGVVTVHTLDKRWSARSMLRWFAQHEPPLHALIDAGALVTNMTNVEIARELLSLGLEWAQGVVFVGHDGRKRILLRGQEDGNGSDLAGSGVSESQRATFFDQSHCTGMDIPQALDARAAITVGKDVTLRDYAQGAWRMRQIGRGQTVVTVLPPEVAALIRAAASSASEPPAAASGRSAVPSALSAPLAGTVSSLLGSSGSAEETAMLSLGLGDGVGLGREASIVDGDADADPPLPNEVMTWLMGNSLKDQTTQLLQLSEQQLNDTWRRPALRALVADPAKLAEGSPERVLRQLEVPSLSQLAMLGAPGALGTRFSSVAMSSLSAAARERISAGFVGDRGRWNTILYLHARGALPTPAGADGTKPEHAAWSYGTGKLANGELLSAVAALEDRVFAGREGSQASLKAAVRCFISPLETPVPAVFEKPTTFSESLADAAKEAETKGWMALVEDADAYSHLRAIVKQASAAESALGMLGATKDVLSRDREMVTQLQLEVDDELDAERAKSIETEVEKESQGQWAEAAKSASRWSLGALDEALEALQTAENGMAARGGLLAAGGILFGLTEMDPIGSQGTKGVAAPASIVPSRLWVTQNQTPRLRPTVGRRRLRNCTVALSIPHSSAVMGKTAGMVATSSSSSSSSSSSAESGTELVLLLSLSEAAALRRLIELDHPDLADSHARLLLVSAAADPTSLPSAVLASATRAIAPAPSASVGRLEAQPGQFGGEGASWELEKWMTLAGRTRAALFFAALYDGNPVLPPDVVPWAKGVLGSPASQAAMRKFFSASVAARCRDGGDWNTSPLRLLLSDAAATEEGKDADETAEGEVSSFAMLETLGTDLEAPAEPLSTLLPEAVRAHLAETTVEAEEAEAVVQTAIDVRLCGLAVNSRTAAVSTPPEGGANSTRSFSAGASSDEAREDADDEVDHAAAAELAARLARRIAPDSSAPERAPIASVADGLRALSVAAKPEAFSNMLGSRTIQGDGTRSHDWSGSAVTPDSADRSQVATLAGVVLHRGCGVLQWHVEVDWRPEPDAVPAGCTDLELLRTKLRPDPANDSIEAGVICATWTRTGFKDARVGDRFARFLSDPEDSTRQCAALRCAPSAAIATPTARDSSASRLAWLSTTHSSSPASKSSSSASSVAKPAASAAGEDSPAGESMMVSGTWLGFIADCDAGRLYVSMNGQPVDMRTGRVQSSSKIEWDDRWCVDISPLTAAPGALGLMPAVSTRGGFHARFERRRRSAFPACAPPRVRAAARMLQTWVEAKEATIHAAALGYLTGRWKAANNRGSLCKDRETGTMWSRPRSSGVEKGGARSGMSGFGGGDVENSPISASLVGPAPRRGRWYFEATMEAWLDEGGEAQALELRAQALAKSIAMHRTASATRSSWESMCCNVGVVVNTWSNEHVVAMPAKMSRRGIAADLCRDGPDAEVMDAQAPESRWAQVAVQSPLLSADMRQAVGVVAEPGVVPALRVSASKESWQLAEALEAHCAELRTVAAASGAATAGAARVDAFADAHEAELAAIDAAPGGGPAGTGSGAKTAMHESVLEEVDGEEEGNMNLKRATTFETVAALNSECSRSVQAYGSGWGREGDVIGVAVDCDSRTLMCSLNGKWELPWGVLMPHSAGNSYLPRIFIGCGFAIRPNTGAPGQPPFKYSPPPLRSAESRPFEPFSRYFEALPFRGRVVGPWVWPLEHWSSDLATGGTPKASAAPQGGQGVGEEEVPADLPLEVLTGSVTYQKYAETGESRPRLRPVRRLSSSPSDLAELLHPDTASELVHTTNPSCHPALDPTVPRPVLLECISGADFPMSFVAGTHTVHHPGQSRHVDGSASSIVAASRSHVGLPPGRWVCAIQLLTFMPVEVGFVDNKCKVAIDALGLATAGMGMGFLRPAGKRALIARDYHRRRALARSPHSRAHDGEEDNDEADDDGPALPPILRGLDPFGGLKRRGGTGRSVGAYLKGPGLSVPLDTALTGSDKDAKSSKVKKSRKPERPAQAWIGSAWRSDDVVAVAIEVEERPRLVVRQLGREASKSSRASSGAATKDSKDATAAQPDSEGGEADEAPVVKPSPPMLFVGQARIGRMIKPGEWAWSAAVPVNLSPVASGVLRPAVLCPAGSGARFMFGGEHDPMPEGITAPGVDGRGHAFEGYAPMASAAVMHSQDVASALELPVLELAAGGDDAVDEAEANEPEQEAAALGMKAVGLKLRKSPL